MVKTQLTKEQQIFLDFFKQTRVLNKNFYFSGGTCLSEFYLHHRFSEDLDFFSETEFDPINVTTYIKNSKKTLNYSKFDYHESFNRNIYQLIFSRNKFLKVEFTYYPFERIEKTKSINNLIIDSLKDIAVNKIFTISQQPRGRDFFDVYFIMKKTKYEISSLLKDARIKFDWHIDYLQFGANLLEVTKLKDDPILINQKVTFNEIEEFFQKETKKLEKKILH